MPGHVHFASQYLILFALKIQQNVALSFERDQVQRAQMATPLRFPILGLSEGCPQKCNGEAEADPAFRNYKGICEPKYLYAIRIIMLEGLISRHHSSVGPG
jgi:hypothetical protein